MKPKTQEFLNLLLWASDMFSRPTFRNLTDSYETWAYRNGLLRQARSLEKQQLLERPAQSVDERVYRLTEQGRLLALGGRDPDREWSRSWDGKWRLVLFDVPSEQNARRARLRRYLRSRCFGWLQNSVWITPDPLEEQRETLAGTRINVEVFLLMEATPCAGEGDLDIVTGAWDFDHINRGYDRHLKVLDQRPRGSIRQDSVAKAFQRWVAEERLAWINAVTVDPLLPAPLVPPGYLGRKAWSRRVKIQRETARQIEDFRADSI